MAMDQEWGLAKDPARELADRLASMWQRDPVGTGLAGIRTTWWAFRAAMALATVTVVECGGTAFRDSADRPWQATMQAMGLTVPHWVLMAMGQGATDRVELDLAELGLAAPEQDPVMVQWATAAVTAMDKAVVAWADTGRGAIGLVVGMDPGEMVLAAMAPPEVEPALEAMGLAPAMVLAELVAVMVMVGTNLAGELEQMATAQAVAMVLVELERMATGLAALVRAATELALGMDLVLTARAETERGA